jgi:hypothetical protein
MRLTVLGSESDIVDRNTETSAILLQNLVVTRLALWEHMMRNVLTRIPFFCYSSFNRDVILHVKVSRPAFQWSPRPSGIPSLSLPFLSTQFALLFFSVYVIAAVIYELYNVSLVLLKCGIYHA